MSIGSRHPLHTAYIIFCYIIYSAGDCHPEGLFKTKKRGYDEKMKNERLLLSAVLVTAIIIGACNNNNSGSVGETENLDKNASYALGLSIGAGYRENLISGGIIPNNDEFIKGIRDGFSGGNARFDMYEAEEIINAAFYTLFEEKNARLMQEEIDFLAGNAKKPGIKITPSGLQYEILIETDGRKPSFNDRVQVHYEGRLTDGKSIGSTYDYGEPAAFALNQVMPGWSEGLQLMSVGSRYRFFIPSEIGYGAGGEGPIPPYSTLIFTVDLLEIY
jgi:FKBP-type peptidyl-prolyl cis-trans isomerase/predicted small secreted protein